MKAISRFLGAAAAVAVLFAVLMSANSTSASASTIISGKLWLVTPAIAGDATPANVPTTTPDITFDAPSPLDFSQLSTATVGQWLASGGATNIVVNTSGALSAPMNYATLVQFTGVVSVTNGETFTVTHDDGMTLAIGSDTVVSVPGPTAPVQTTATYTGPTGIFGFQLVYGELDGAPAVLQVDLPLANPTITLNPPSATNPVGTSHTVTATVDDNGSPAQGVQVGFSVIAGPNTGTTGTCSSANCVTGSSGNVSWTYTGNTAGIDTIQACVTLTQACTTATKVWYDPSAGFVTGGGWIPSLVSGHANFGFVAKYQSGGATPVGSLEFQDQAKSVNFHSNSFDWLVVPGDGTAQLHGSGTLNGTSGYTFQLAVSDNSPDTFGLQIWNSSGTLVYSTNGAVGLNGGNIQIHS